jgi:hypothetical protein
VGFRQTIALRFHRLASIPIVYARFPRHNAVLVILACPAKWLGSANGEVYMLRLSSLTVALSIVLGTATISAAQQIHLPPAVSQSQGMGGIPVSSGTDTQRQQALAANQQRQVEIRRDTEKMAELTQELKDYLQKPEQQGVMSVDAIKKAEQIEKLAHSIKSKMKQSF